ncbi:hypothetical protein [Microbacterium sp. NPDC057650]|uniref:hypothetical protein n=1 Tax=unclassified Microbacterium TaxID=2609290 RepID=UPI00366BA73F
MLDDASPFEEDLRATGAHPDFADELALFGRFVGEWRMRVRFYEADGACVYDEPGRWTFGWVLDGRAVQDVLSGPAPGRGEAAGERRIGSSMRMFDAATRAWHVVWFGASSGAFVVLHGGADADRIVLLGEPEADGAISRWIFSDITQESFRWLGEESRDGGRTWFIRQRMEGTRT